MRLSVLLYERSGCGLRSIVKILKVFNEVFGDVLGKIPSPNTIENWVKKCGLDVFQNPGEVSRDKSYVMIVDESMSIGGQKLLLVLAIPADLHGRPPRHGDVTVLGMSVKNSWTGQDIAAEMQLAIDKVGHQPEYVITDNVSSMAKAARLAGTRQHLDISHSFGMFLERAYKNSPDYQQYVKQLGQVKFKYNMTKFAYLLPPSQRVISRFLNLFEWVKWSRRMLEVFPTLDDREKEVFSFVHENASLVKELAVVMECHERVEAACKHRGLSKHTASKSRRYIKQAFREGNHRVKRLEKDMLDYLEREAAMLGPGNDVHCISSDIIESLFGTYKKRKSPNKLNGVTSFVLFIPLEAKLNDKNKARVFHFKESMECYKIKDIQEWTKKNLLVNCVVKRIKVLKATG